MKVKHIFLFVVLLLSTLVVVSHFNITTIFKCDNNEVVIGGSGGYPKSPVSLKMYDLLEKYSSEYDVPRYIAYNVAFLETRYQGPFDWSYDPYLTSSAGAVGPMQIMPSTANHINKRKINKETLKNDLELNIETSMKLLSKLYERYENWGVVCGCYNTGRPIVNGYAVFCSSNKNYRDNWIYVEN